MRLWIDRIKRTGVSSIVIFSIINKIIGLFLSVIVVRILSKQDYGVYSYANNITSMFLIISGLGIKNGVLQFCCENRSEEEKSLLYQYGLKFGTFVNVIIAASLFLYATFGNLSITEGRYVLYIQILIPVINYINEYGLVFLRTKLLNDTYAKATNVHSINNFVFSIAGAYVGGLYGYIIGQYLATFTAICYIILKSKNQISDVKEACRDKVLSVKSKIELVKFSVTCAVTNAFSSLLGYLDVFLLGIMLANPLILASYKASSTIPDAAKFFTITIMLCVYPLFAKNKDNRPWLKKYIKLLIAGLFAFNFIVFLILFFGAELIVGIVYGNQYLDAVPVFKILVVSYLFATTLRIPYGNLLLMLRKERFNFVLAIISGVCNIILDVILIPKYESIGAAFATLMVVIITSLLSLVCVQIEIYKSKD